MVDTKAVAAFFDRLAPGWDAGMVRREAIINEILDNAGVQKGDDVLDVACGTGVLIPDYLARGAASVTAVDLSENMVSIAREKFQSDPRVTVLCADAQFADYGRQFDRIVIYNAFPHFADPKGLIRALSRVLNPSGTLTVAHDRSREAMIAHHKNVPSAVSGELMSIEALTELMEESLDVVAAISDGRMYQAVGRRRETVV